EDRAFRIGGSSGRRRFGGSGWRWNSEFDRIRDGRRSNDFVAGFSAGDGGCGESVDAGFLATESGGCRLFGGGGGRAWRLDGDRDIGGGRDLLDGAGGGHRFDFGSGRRGNGARRR